MYDLCFKVKNPIVSTVLSSFMDPYAFTGHSNEKPKLLPLAVRLPEGELKATLGQPTVLRC